jgi:predicted ATPase
MAVQRIVFTGGPGAGKTTLLDALAARGHPYVPESARAIIRDRKARGLSARPPPREFARQALRLDIERYRSVLPGSGRAFFDRAIPDALGLLDDLGLLSAEELARHLAAYPYFPKVFVLPPWRQIYRQDEERDQSFAESVRVHDRLRQWYERCGYELVSVPCATVEERCEFVLDALDGRAGGAIA